MSADNKKQQQEQPPHVCVIGAGVCGLIAVKACLENGLRVSCFDKSSKYGGLWHYRPDDNNNNNTGQDAPPFEPSVMRTTILNTSKELSSFSDFPPPATRANFMRHSHYMEYIHSYVAKFQLREHLHLEHEILKCWPVWHEQEQRIEWLVEVRDLKEKGNGQAVTRRSFDRLMVAVGHHNIPYAPTYEGQRLFKGEVIHSARLKDILGNPRFVDKRVLVVGFGNSACDAANDLALVAQKCYVSCHRGQWFTPRFLHSGPHDQAIKNRMYYYASKLLPTCVIDRATVSKVEQRVNHKMLGLKPRHKPSEGVPAINDLFPYRIYTGGIVLKSSIRTFTERGVKFEGEDEQEEHPVDIVVLATGYEARIGFLDELGLGLRSREHQNEYELFLNIFAPKLKLGPENFGSDEGGDSAQNETNNNNNNSHYIALDDIKKQQQQQQAAAAEDQRPTPLEVIKSLAFIGLVQPNGSMTVVAELQARYASLVFAGRLELPRERRMLAHMEQVRRMRAKAIRSHSRDQLIGNYVGYLERVASLIGVRPNLCKLFFADHRLWRALMFGPTVPYQYRLAGPGQWDGARDACLTASDRVYAGINEGKNHILYRTRRKCLTDAASQKNTKAAAAAVATKDSKRAASKTKAAK